MTKARNDIAALEKRCAELQKKLRQSELIIDALVKERHADQEVIDRLAKLHAAVQEISETHGGSGKKSSED